MSFFYTFIIDPLLKNMRKTAAEKAAGTDKIIDIGCGIGTQTFFYSKNNKAEVWGADINPEMINIAEKRKNSRKINNIHFQLANAAHLPFDEKFFDASSICLTLHEMDYETRIRAISEMKRVVRPGGQMFLMDFQAPLPLHPFTVLLHAIERMAGMRNYKCFTDYLEKKGLTGLLESLNLKVREKIMFNFGLIAFIEVENA